MLRQKAKMSSFRGGVCREQMQVEQCALHPSSCFSFRWRVDWRTEESVTALQSRSLVLIIVRPSICHVIDMPPRVMKSPGMPLTPASQGGPVFARLALLSVHTRTNLIWPEGGSCDWWFHHVSSATAIWPSSTAEQMLVCGCACVCVCNCLNVTVNRKFLCNCEEGYLGQKEFECVCRHTGAEASSLAE